VSFEKLGIFDPLLDAIEDLGYKEPTPIQSRSIPLIFAKKDIFATAQTGTGKSAAFGLPLLQRLRNAHKSEKNHPKALVLAPTRELAMQLADDFASFAKYMDINIALLIGGKDLTSQNLKLKERVDIIVATPGRVMEHTQKGLKLTSVEIFVVDEADRMLDMGFSKDLLAIAALLPKRHQSLLFSATYSQKVRDLAKLLLTKPEFVQTAKQNSTVENIEQVAYLVDADKKASLLAYIVGSRNYTQVLVFTRTKASADELAREIEKDGLKCGIIHGEKTQAARTKALALFKERRLRVLVATDIASRGLDIEDLDVVFNYELPLVPEDYVHRVGRTGRAGKSGLAISLLDANEKSEIRRIEKLIGKKLPKESIKGFEPDPTLRRSDEKEITPKSEHKKRPNTRRR